MLVNLDVELNEWIVELSKIAALEATKVTGQVWCSQSLNGAHKDWVCGLALLHEGLLVSGCRGGVLKLWATETCLPLGEIKAHSSPINAVTTNSTCIFSASKWVPSIFSGDESITAIVMSKFVDSYVNIPDLKRTQWVLCMQQKTALHLHSWYFKVFYPISNAFLWYLSYSNSEYQYRILRCKEFKSFSPLI